MGRDKAGLPFGHESLLDRVVRLVRTRIDDVVLAAAAGQEVPAGIVVVRDVTSGEGPLAALHGALRQVHHPHTFVVACDTPLLVPGIIPVLAERGEGWEAAVPVVNGVWMTTCAVYETAAALRKAGALLHSRERRPGSRAPGLRALIDQLRTRVVRPEELAGADPALLSFIPCNTPDEYRRALALAGLG